MAVLYTTHNCPYNSWKEIQSPFPKPYPFPQEASRTKHSLVSPNILAQAAGQKFLLLQVARNDKDFYLIALVGV